jgi:hypothetical protein
VVVRTEMWRGEGGEKVVFRMCVGKRVVIAHAAVELGEEREPGEGAKL